MKKILILSLLYLNSTMLFAKAELLDEIVAIVDEGVILRSELDRAVDNIVQQFKARGAQLPPQSVLDQQVLDRLINQELQIQKANEAGVQISEAEVDQALSQVASQNKLTLQQMQMAVENDGMNFSEFRNDMRRELKSERIRNGLASQNVKVSEHEIDMYLADNDMSQSEVELGHILVALESEADTATTKKVKQKAEKLYNDLMDGANFEDMAILYSSGQNAKEGGNLGWRSIKEVPTLFADQLKVMKVGEITHPVRSASGYHIIKLKNIREQQSKLITQYHARHILIENSELVTPAQGMEIINEIYSQLNEGKDFEKLAEEKSDDVTSAALGGDLGWFQLNDFGGRFGEVVSKLDDGEVSSPFQTSAGWHIVKRIGKRESDVTEEFKRRQAKQAIYARKMNEEIESWLSQIRGEAFVDIRL